MLARALDSIHRRDGGRILATLIKRFGSFDLAEDSLQDAYAKALQHWLRDGVPQNPSAWIALVARRCALDRLKHDRRSNIDSLDAIASLEALDSEPHDLEPDATSDELLSLIFVCCHPAIAQTAQVALALRTLCGFSTREIARALVEPETTTAQRIVRAKRKILTARVRYAVPTQEELMPRLAGVLAVIYFIFNEGYVASRGNDLLRPNLCKEAIRLGRMLNTYLCDQPEALGLLALMLFHDSRRMTRTDSAGALVPLEDQDRREWDRSLITEATRTLESALALRRPGPYQIQAAIGSLHANANTAAETDWRQISALYVALLHHAHTPVTELNAAVALAMATSPEDGLAWIDRIEAAGHLDTYHLLYAAKADLLRRATRFDEARVYYQKAIDLVQNPGERRYMQGRLMRISPT